MRTISPEGLATIKQWEGLRLAAYRDVGGVWTIGWGHTATAREGMTISEAEAERLLRADLRQFEAAVDRLVTVPLSDNQFAALVSFAFNVGVGAFGGSTLLRRLNAGEYDAVPAELARWNKVKGVTVAGLANRRAAEAGLWARGAFVTSAGPTTAEPAVPKLLTMEHVTAGATAAGGLGAVMSGDGPAQYAFAAVIVIAALVGAYLLLRSRRRT